MINFFSINVFVIFSKNANVRPMIVANKPSISVLMYILDNEVVLRDYNFVDFKDSISIFNIQEYMKIFLPKLNTDEINKIIEKCKKDFTPSVMEKYLTPGLNEHLLYSEHYAEPIDMIIQYAHLLYKTLYYLIKDKYHSDILPILGVNNIRIVRLLYFLDNLKLK